MADFNKKYPNVTQKLLSTANVKIKKGEKDGYKSFILHFAPAKSSGFEVCAKSSPQCREFCLNKSGHGLIVKTDGSAPLDLDGNPISMVVAARIKKTQAFFEHKSEFMDKLVNEIHNGIKLAEKQNLIPCFRLNGTSDLPFHKIRINYQGKSYRSIMHAFPQIQFYDYTKIMGSGYPKNYHLTFSKSENNQNDVIKAVARGLNVAVVFNVLKGNPLPPRYLKKRVIDGDNARGDLRFLDPKNSIVGLIAKGKAVNNFDPNGFVVQVEHEKMIAQLNREL